MKKLMFLMMVCGMFFIAAGNTSAQSCVPKDNEVALFKDWKFEGDCKVLKIHGYLDIVTNAGFENDAVSSIKVGKNVQAVVCEHNNFQGVCQTFTADNEFLEGTEIGNDTISSLKVFAKVAASGNKGNNNSGNANREENPNSSAATEKFSNNLVGAVWANEKETMIFGESTVEFQYVNDKKPYVTSLYRVVNEKTVEFTDEGGNANTATMTISDDGQTLTWYRPDQGKNFVFKRKSKNQGNNNSANANREENPNTSSNPNSSADANKSGCSMDKGGKEIPINWVNKTGFEIRFEWVNFDCEPEDRGTIKPGETFEQSSFAGHVFRVSYYASESDEPRWIEFKKVTVSPSNKSMNITMD